jgi:outer membrane protein TolC
VAEELPTLNLTGSLSRQALTDAGLFHHFNSLWGAGGTLAAPLFQGGALRAQVRAARDAFTAQTASYQNTVLEALGQVADDLRSLANDADRLKVSQHALAIASESLKLQQISYAAGKTTVLQLIDAERTSAQAKLSFATARVEQYEDTAGLLVALGGGWWESQVAQK